MTKRFFNVYRAALAAVLIAVLIPLIAISFYNRPSCDDVYLPYPAMNALQSGGTLWDAVKAAAQDTWSLYFSVNGSFASIFLNHFPATIFNYKLAWIHPIVFMLLLVAICFRFARCVRVYCPETPKAVAACSALVLSIMFLTLMPYPSEGLYWYVGAMAYTFSFEIAVLMACDIAILYREDGLKKRGGTLRLVLLCIGGVYLGGSNLVVPTFMIVVYGFFMLWLLMRKGSKLYLLPFLFLVIGYLFGVLAPGNFSRQSGTGEPLSIPLAFIESFLSAFQIGLADVSFWLFSLLLLPMAIVISRYVRFQYRYYLLPPAACLCVLAASIFPELFAMRTMNMYRMVDMRLFMRGFMVFICMIYYAGFARHLLAKSRTAAMATAAAAATTAAATHATAAATLTAAPTKMPSTPASATAPVLPTLKQQHKLLPYLYVAVVAVLFVLSSVPDLQLSPLTFDCQLTPVKAFSALRDGEVQRYAEEYDQLVEIIRSHPGEDITVSLNPAAFCFMDAALEGDPAATPNSMFAIYYGCNSITFDPEAAGE